MCVGPTVADEGLVWGRPIGGASGDSDTLTVGQPRTLQVSDAFATQRDGFVVSATSTATASLVRGSQVPGLTTTQRGTLFSVGQTKQHVCQRAFRQPSIGQRLALADRTEHCHQHSVEAIGTFDALCR